VRVAFIGVGTMGRHMARHLVAAGHDVTVHDRSVAAMHVLVESGCAAADTAALATEGADVVMLSLPGPPEVVDAVLGADGVMEAASPPSLVVDLSTNGVDTVAELRARCGEHGVAFVDAPVTGGVMGAEAGTLSVMVGSTADEFDVVRPLLAAFGSNVVRVGEPGAGTVAKLVNNQVFLACSLVVQEGFVHAAARGIDPAAMAAILNAGTASAYVRFAPLLLGRTFDDVIFRLDIAAKDLELATASAADAGVNTSVTAAAAEAYRQAVAGGWGDQVFHATLRLLERDAGVELPPLGPAHAG
jgi:3-hydroxyisobutyrate dehydrogenase-like beta-hydroxyacid dehydrogenase